MVEWLYGTTFFQGNTLYTVQRFTNEEEDEQ